MTPQLSAVVVAYDSMEHIRSCLGSVARDRTEVILVDNASPADEAGLACAEFPGTKVIRLPRNAGFARAANAGIRAAASPWILLLNPDAWAIGNAVARLTSFAATHPRIAAAGPRLLDPAGRPTRSALRAPLSPATLAVWSAAPAATTRAYSVLRPLRGNGRRHRLGRDEFLQGAVLLLRRDAFDAVGGFDEDFFMYGEDADLCERLRSAGWRVELYEAAEFVHVGGGSTGTRRERMDRELLRSWLRLIAKRDGLARARRARRWLIRALRIKAVRDPAARATADWLTSRPLDDLLGGPHE